MIPDPADGDRGHGLVGQHGPLPHRGGGGAVPKGHGQLGGEVDAVAEQGVLRIKEKSEKGSFIFFVLSCVDPAMLVRTFLNWGP